MGCVTKKKKNCYQWRIEYRKPVRIKLISLFTMANPCFLLGMSERIVRMNLLRVTDLTREYYRSPTHSMQAYRM